MLRLNTETLTDGSKVFDVVFTPLMPEGVAPIQITFYCYDEEKAHQLETTLDQCVTGVATHAA